VSVAYITRLLAGREALACAVVETPDGPQSVLVQAGVDNHVYCTAAFLLIHFFATSACVWWLLLTLLWFVVVSTLATRAAVERRAWIVHVVAWTTPAALTVAVLIDRSVDADELTGLCHVGGPPSRRWLLVVAPLAVSLVAGSAFLAAGFVRPAGALFAEPMRRSHVRSSLVNRRPADRREALVLRRVGVYCLLYAVLAAAELACHVHALVSASVRQRSSSRCALLMIQGARTLVVGAVSGAWICSERTTIRSWKILLERLRCRLHRCGSERASNNDSSKVAGRTPGNTHAVRTRSQDRPIGLPSASHRYQHHHRHYHYHHPGVKTGCGLPSRSRIGGDGDLSKL